MITKEDKEKEDEDENSFYKSFRWVLVFGQICGLIPVRGIFGPNQKRLRFTWKNPALLYTLFSIVVTTFFDYALAKELLHVDVTLDSLAPTAFYTTCLLATFMFLNLARKFPEIASDFYKLEENMAEYGYPKRLGLKTKTFILVFGFLATAEHGTMIILNLKYALIWASNNENVDLGKEFFSHSIREVSEIIPYSPIAVVCCVWANFVCTLTWNYLDFFVIAISMQLSSRLRLINDEVSKIDVKKKNSLSWLKVLKGYNQISLLVKKLDKILSNFILLSLVNDLYHISLQLLRSFRVQGGTFQKLYFHFSLFYLIARLLTSAFCMAQIEEESKKSLDKFFCIKEPTSESNRMFYQILTDDVHFTGNQFFAINRSFVCTVVGTLITYQVILLQIESLHSYWEKA